MVRHRVKRLVREAYRLQEEKFASGLDLVVIARVTAKNISYWETESALLHLGGLQNILKSAENDNHKNSYDKNSYNKG